MNKQNREGDYYASKVRQYLNEYDGITKELSALSAFARKKSLATTAK